MAKGRPDFSPTAADVILSPEWGAIEGNDKTLRAWGTDIAPGDGVEGLYLVPAGKTVYIHVLSGRAVAQLVTDRELNQAMWVNFSLDDGANYILETGANFGVHIVLQIPLVVTAGNTVWWYAFNASNHNQALSAYIRFLEV